jgi:uncharacterized membrane protein (UPF0127 family)
MAGLSLGALAPVPILAQKASAPARTAQVDFPDRTSVKAEIAATEAERELGLMHRTSLGDTAGMIFVFEAPGLHAFWMKDTLIPLDMLWLDANGKVVSLAETVPPCKADPCATYPPSAPASFVLEVQAGFAKKHHVRVGDTVAVSGIDLKKPLPQ